jgi:multidrug efflux pump subunit AcrA (membrane-fusion protein)
MRCCKSHVQQVSTQIKLLKQILKSNNSFPINGTVALRSIDIGEKVTDETNLFVIINTMQVYCIAQINEKDLLHIKTNQSVELTVDALENKKFNGKVSIISPILDQSSRTAEIKILCNNNDSQLRPGMFARASIFTQTIKDAIIKSSFINQESYTSNVFIIKNNLHCQRSKIFKADLE